MENKREKIFTRDFLLVFLAGGLMRACNQMQNTLMPLYMGQLGYTATMVGLSTTACTTASLILRPVMGGLLDRFGRRGIVIAGTALFAAATLLCGVFGGLSVLIALRVLQGIGFSAHTTAVNTMATDILPEKRMAEGIGYMGLTSSISMAIAPGLALGLVQGTRYSGGFYAAFAAGALAVLCLCLVRCKDVKAGKDAPGGEKLKLLDRLWEKHAARPALIMMILGACYAGTNTFMAVYALGEGFTKADMSVYFAVNAAATAAARLFCGRASARLGEKRTMLLSSCICCAAFLMVPFAGQAWLLWAAAALHGLGYGTIYPLLNAMAVTSASPQRRGVAMATFLTGTDIGMGFGAGVWGAIIDRIGMRSMFLCGAVVCAAVYAAYRLILYPVREGRGRAA